MMICDDAQQIYLCRVKQSGARRGWGYDTYYLYIERIQTNFKLDFYESRVERVRPSDGIQYRLRLECQRGGIDFTAVALTKPNVPDLEHLD